MLSPELSPSAFSFQCKTSLSVSVIVLCENGAFERACLISRAHTSAASVGICGTALEAATFDILM
jgi:hypothetical protein